MELIDYKKKLDVLIITSKLYLPAKELTVYFTIKNQIDVLFKVDEDMCNLMIEHGKSIDIGAGISTQLWLETAWSKTLRKEIDRLKVLKEEIENESKK